jgi:hypothetical protein
LPRYRAALLLTTLLLAGCTGDDRPSTGDTASRTPESATTPVSTATPASTATSASATTPAAAPFPFTVNRRGGFAGVDDRAEIAADGTVVVTTRDRAATPSPLPVATMDELRGLLTSPGFTGQTASPGVPACNDGFEYELVTPAATVTVHDCGTSHGPTVDRIVAISANLFNG